MSGRVRCWLIGAPARFLVAERHLNISQSLRDNVETEAVVHHLAGVRHQRRIFEEGLDDEKIARAVGPLGARNLFIIETFLKNPALMPYARQMMNDGLSLDVVAQALANIQMPLSD